MQLVNLTIQNVEIQSLVSWPLYFRRICSPGDVMLEPQSKFPDYIELNELQAQCRARNALFTGVDGHGNHARIRIVDDEVRRSLLGDASDNAVLLTHEAVKDLLAIKGRDAFAQRLAELVQTNAEKHMIVQLAEKLGIDECEGWKQNMLKPFYNIHYGNAIGLA